MRWSRRSVLKDDERRFTPWTKYPFERRNSARYAPSCPVAPVMSATLPDDPVIVVLQVLQQPTAPTSGDTASSERMGAALIYARRYALFTRVGIGGEDDLDARAKPSSRWLRNQLRPQLLV